MKGKLFSLMNVTMHFYINFSVSLIEYTLYLW